MFINDFAVLYLIKNTNEIHLKLNFLIRFDLLIQLQRRRRKLHIILYTEHSGELGSVSQHRSALTRKVNYMETSNHDIVSLHNYNHRV